MDTTQRTRYEVPALIVVDAVDEQDAWTRARNLSATLAAETGPGAFFCEIGIAATNRPRVADDLEGRETVGQHVESVRTAVGDEWVWEREFPGTCEKCGQSGLDPDLGSEDGRLICDECRDKEADR